MMDLFIMFEYFITLVKTSLILYAFGQSSSWIINGMAAVVWKMSEVHALISIYIYNYTINIPIK